ncbi:MAG: hypothetical protein JW798_12795 [Prolixibacteraceae bacterium]|nr:hypothetical protein [Prolixibacteraceae bacterium]
MEKRIYLDILKFKNKLLTFPIILFLVFQLLLGCERDPNSIKIDVEGVIVEKETRQPISEVSVTFTNPSGGIAITTSYEDGTFQHQFFGSETAKLTLEKEGYVFENLLEGTDSVVNYKIYTEGNYEKEVLEMRKLPDEL